MTASRIDRLLLALYPHLWRDRYGEELLDVMATSRTAGARPGRLRLDVIRAAGVERLRAAELLGAAPAPARVRGGSLLVLWAWTFFVLAGCTVAKCAEHWQQAVPAGRERLAADAFDALSAVAGVSALLVALALAAAAPLLLPALRSGLWPTLRRRVGCAVALTAAELPATVGLVHWAGGLTDRQRNGHDLAYGLAFLSWAALGALCFTAWVAVASTAARRVDPPVRVLRLHVALGAGVAVAMPAMTAAALTWWAILPAAASVPTGPLAAALAVMVVASVLAGVGARRSVVAVRGCAQQR